MKTSAHIAGSLCIRVMLCCMNAGSQQIASFCLLLCQVYMLQNDVQEASGVHAAGAEAGTSDAEGGGNAGWCQTTGGWWAISSAPRCRCDGVRFGECGSGICKAGRYQVCQSVLSRCWSLCGRRDVGAEDAERGCGGKRA